MDTKRLRPRGIAEVGGEEGGPPRHHTSYNHHCVWGSSFASPIMILGYCIQPLHVICCKYLCCTPECHSVLTFFILDPSLLVSTAFVHTHRVYDLMFVV